MKSYDVIVIGAGPAGYVAAIRCAQLGLKTACIDNWLNNENESSLGGTCLNVGCIPSKALLDSSELYEKSLSQFEDHGIKVKNIALDVKKMIHRKDKIVNELTSGIAALFKANDISFLSGHGKLIAEQQVELTQSKSGDKVIMNALHIILAPGSLSKSLPSMPYVDKLIVDSTGALEFDSVPNSIAIIGAGVIGLELGTVWRRLGAKITIFEFCETLLPQADKQIAQQATKTLIKQGLNFYFSTSVTGHAIKNDQVCLTFENNKGKQQACFDKVIIAIGREPNVTNIFSSRSGLKLDKKGFIDVDAQCKTNIKGVYAIGDAVRGPMLAHKGSEEGMMVAELIAGQSARVNYETIPFVVYTAPELAWCGKTEQELKDNGQRYHVGSFSFASNGRARALAQTEGLIKILADAKTDRILGVHMLGPHVSELIAQAVIAMEFGSSSEDLAMTMFAHPSLSEAMHEAALDVDSRAIHKVSRKRN